MVNEFLTNLLPGIITRSGTFGVIRRAGAALGSQMWRVIPDLIHFYCTRFEFALNENLLAMFYGISHGIVLCNKNVEKNLKP